MRVYDLSDPAVAGVRVSFNGRLTDLGEMRFLLRNQINYGDDIGHYIVTSKTESALMYFTGRIDLERLIVFSIVPLTDLVFAGWKGVLKALKAEELDVVCDPNDHLCREACLQTGLMTLAQRIKFTVSRSAALPDMTYLRLEQLSLDQSISLGKMAIRRDGKRATEMLRDLSFGLASGIVVPNDNGDIVGALFYNECTERLQSEGVFIDAVPGTHNWNNWSLLLTNAFIREAKRLKKPCIQAFSPHVAFNNMPHVTTEVVSLHYGIAGRGIGQVL